MATGANLQPARGRQTTANAPTVNTDTGEAGLWRSVGQVGQEIEALSKPGLIRSAQWHGAEEGAAYAAGAEKPKRGPLSFGEVAEARERATTQAYIAGVSTDFDTREADVQRENPFSVEGYERRMAEVRSGFIQSADPEHAVQLEQYFNRRVEAGRSSIADAVSRVAIEQANAAMVERTGMLEGKLLELIDRGEGNTVDYRLVQDDLRQQYAERVNNPAMAYSQVEADNDLNEFMGRAAARASVFHVRQVLRSEGADAALAALQELRVGPSPFVSPSAAAPEGLAVPGNIDLGTRPTVENPDGTVSTVRSITIEVDGRAVLIPTVSDEGEVVSDEDAIALFESTGRHLGMFETQAQADAYAQALHEDQAAGRAPYAQMTPAQRELAFAAAREAVNSEISLDQQRRNLADSERSARLAEINRRIDEDVASIELNGETTDLTQDQVYSAGGADAVVRWLKKKADAYEFNELVGDLPLNDPEAAARQISQRTTRRASLDSLPMIADGDDFDALVAAMSQVETPGRPDLISRDPDGPGGGGGGAYGDMQVLPATAERIARTLGLQFSASNPADLERLRTDVAFNQRIGRQYLSELTTRYAGDTLLAVTAYHAGEGNVDGWLRSVGDPRSGGITREAWLVGIERRGNPLSAAYPRKVLEAMGAGRASAAWTQYQSRRQAQATDPGEFVQTDFAVRTARERWQATPTSVPAAENFVANTLSAQDRGGVTDGNRQTLPGRSLAVYAGDLLRYERANDTAGYQAYSQRIVRNFGRYGERVLQDVLEVRGDTRFSAMVNARAAATTANGQRPAPGTAQQASTAAAAQQMSRAASGTTRPEDASDDDIRRALGL